MMRNMQACHVSGLQLSQHRVVQLPCGRLLSDVVIARPCRQCLEAIDFRLQSRSNQLIRHDLFDVQAQ